MDSPRTQSERRTMRGYGFQEESKRTPNGFRANRNPGRAGKGRGGERWEREAEGHRAHAREAEAKQRDRESRLRPQVRETGSATAAWATVSERLQGAVSDSTFRLWLEPLRCIGEVKGALALAAAEGIATWVQRRYGSLVGDAIREATDFRGAFIFREQPGPPSDEEAML